MPPTGLQPTLYCTTEIAVTFTLVRVYYDQIPPDYNTQLLSERNEQIRQQYATGYSIPQLADVYNLSNARIHQIIRSGQLDEEAY